MGNQVTPSDLKKGEKYLVEFGTEKFVSIFMGEIECPHFGSRYVFVGYSKENEPYLPMCFVLREAHSYVEALP